MGLHGSMELQWSYNPLRQARPFNGCLTRGLALIIREEDCPDIRQHPTCKELMLTRVKRGRKNHTNGSLCPKQSKTGYQSMVSRLP